MNESIDKCIWKFLEENDKSSSFQDVRNNPEAPLYKCIACDGYNNTCDYYNFKRKYEKKVYS